MIELKHDELVFTFPEVHPEAELRITFQRTLRIPDDGNTYPLPPGLDSFPLKHVDDYADNVPKSWLEHGGVMLPMYQSEALWINLTSQYLDRHRTRYPFAVKIATGKINAVTGDIWKNNLNNNPQDYVVTNRQHWLDGYCVEKEMIRQFVAMPLGAGYSAEEQITGKAEHGGLQIIVYPMARDIFEKKFPERDIEPVRSRSSSPIYCLEGSDGQMGLAPGGRMKQEIYEDFFGIDSWDQGISSRCFAHISNSLVWRSITGENPPLVPLTSKVYNEARLPWFDYYSDNGIAVDGSDKLNGLKTIAELGKEKGDVPLPENESLTIDDIISIISTHFAFPAFIRKDQIREGTF